MGHRVSLDLLDALGQAPSQRDSPGGDAQQHDVGRAVGPFQYLVCDPGERPPDLGGFQDRLRVGRAGSGRATARRTGRREGLIAGRMQRMHATDLLSRLTGRALKDDLSWPPYQEERRDMGCRGVAPRIGPGEPPGRGVGPPAGKLGPGSGVDWVTMSDSCHTERRRISNTREASRARPPEQPERLSQRASRDLGLDVWAISTGPGASGETRKLTRFLLFGLTWSRLRPTVTVRNRY
jgi:hypothetical protein